MEGYRVEGVLTSDGRRYLARAVVVTAGTFLRGRIHMGLDTPVPAGRAGESPAVEIAQHLELLGLTVERFKTGTPPRIDGRSVDLTRLERQDGESEPYWFSHFDRPDHPEQLPCYLTRTGPELNDIIRDHLELSALYGGAISGRGPRYCPSIEDKVVRFPDAESHQVFLEPEGLETHEMYVNGLSTSLPPDVQVAYLRSVPGLDRVEMTRPGYAIEYDYFPPTQLNAALGVKGFDGLFFAGQINGTTGYEEAAGQGVVAGINAAAFALAEDSVTIGRDAAFIGVLIDDLVTRGVDEPYRLFTSRAEFRLLLRQDNALRRLLPLADSLGTLTDAERRVGERSLRQEDTILDYAKERMVFPTQVNELLGSVGTPPVTQAVRVADLVRRPGVMLHEVLLAAGEAVDRGHAHWGEVELKYEGYVTRERELASKTASMESFELPVDFDYPSAVTIAFEAREKLSLVRPSTLGQAGRVPGVTPSDLQNLIVEVLRRRRAVPLP
jgi:tRNA uridine 5-carboxymethylaminomethyl modification enzyme